MYDLIIIGCGPAGISAAIYAKRSNLNTVVFERTMPGGTLNNLDKIENYLGFDSISGPDLAMNFYMQFKKLNIPMISEDVLEIKNNGKEKIVLTKTKEYKAKSIIIATGRGPQKLDLPNNDIRGISYCVLCDGSLYKNKDVAIYGNNPKVLEDVIYLSNIVKRIYLIVNDNKLHGSKEMIEKVNNIENLNILFNSHITKISGNEAIESVNTEEKSLSINGLFINNDFGPLTYFCKNLNILDKNGYVLVDQNQESSIKGIFACGDCTKKKVYQVVTAASEGASASINAYNYIKGIK
jgi:thioredoxin reductase (NADPH)